MLSPEIVHNHTVLILLWCLVRQRKNRSLALIAMKILCFSQTIVKISMLTQGKYISDTILDFIKIPDNNVRSLVMSP